MAKFIAALWSCNTSKASLHCQKTIDEKYSDFQSALEVCQKRVDANIAELSATNEFQAIFAAPEYFFTAAGPHRLPLDERDKVLMESKLLASSKAFGKILIVPGSVYYTKSLSKAVGSLKLDRTAGQLSSTKEQKDRRPKALETINKVAQFTLNRDGAGDNDLGTRLVYKHGDVGLNDISGLPVPSILTKHSAIKDHDPLILRNSTYLYLNGTRYAKYDKQFDYHESLNAPDDMVFLPGTNDQCPIIGGHKFGVEICADHALAIMKRRNPDNLDFHLVVSDWVKNQVENMAMSKFGYFLHASSEPSQTQVRYREPKGSVIDLTHQKSAQRGWIAQGTGKLHFWLLGLPKDYKAVK